MSTAETAETADLRRLKSDREWYGYLTLENFDAVAERLRSLLTGRTYTWASTREHQVRAPEVRTRQRLREGINTSRSTLDDGRVMAHLNAADTYGVWGVSTTIPDQKTAYTFARDEKKARRLTEVTFKHGHHDGGRIEIEQYNGYGERLYWVIAVESPEEQEQ
jgi:hypothetical protein